MTIPLSQLAPRRRHFRLGLHLLPFVRRAFLRADWTYWNRRDYVPVLRRWWWPGWTVMWAVEGEWERWRICRRPPSWMAESTIPFWVQNWIHHDLFWYWHQWDRLVDWWHGLTLRFCTPWFSLTLALHADDCWRGGLLTYYPRWWSGAAVAWKHQAGWRFGEGEQVYEKDRRWEWRRWEARERVVAEGVGLEVVRVGADGEPERDRGRSGARILGE